MAQSRPGPSSTDCATIVKRGYLNDKRAGILLERKRWYVLRQDLAQRCCVLEYYKEEKSAAKGEAPKGFINVHDVVEVQRVTDKKHMFEILCPGVGHRLMANSEVEADEWTDALRKLILYRKDTVSLAQAHSQNSVNQSYPPSTASVSPKHLPPHSLAIPTPSLYPNSSTEPPHPHSLHHNLPTPPECTSSPPIPSIIQPSMQRQRSVEAVPTLPSPSTSSDSSSMCSSSNASCDAQSVFDVDSESRMRFRVHVKETENLSVSGPADLVLSEEGIALHSVHTGQELVMWPIGSLRRYGVNNVCFTIVTGRYCTTGEGRFQFYTQQSRVIHSKVHAMATQKARRSSEPICNTEAALLRSQQYHHTTTTTTTTTTLPPSLGTSPPSIHYTHINHTLVPSTSQEQYGKLIHSGTTLAPEYSRLNHSQTLPAKPVTLLHPPTPQGHLCSHCSARQAATLPHLHHMTGQISYLSSSPSSHPHLPPSHTIVTSYLPGTNQTPPLRLVSRSQSAEESSPTAFQSNHTTDDTRFYSRGAMSPTLL